MKTDLSKWNHHRESNFCDRIVGMRAWMALMVRLDSEQVKMRRTEIEIVIVSWTWK